MKLLAPCVLAASLALSLGALSPVAIAADAHPNGHEAGPAKLQLNQGKKWATDLPLRKSMVAIREIVRGAPAPLHKGTARPEAYSEVGNRVEAEVGRIVKECKLPPHADAQLHIVVADLVAGADAMKGARDAKAGRAGLIKVNGAVTAYASHFDHPGWK